MTVERSYRVDLRRIEQDVVTELLGSGALVPDTRLQAITEAWNERFQLSDCKHSGQDDLIVQRNNGIRWITCTACHHDFREIHPDLPALLDALTEEDNDVQ